MLLNQIFWTKDAFTSVYIQEQLLSMVAVFNVV